MAKSILRQFTILAPDADKIREKMAVLAPASLNLSELNKELTPGREINFVDPEKTPSFFSNEPYALFIDDELTKLAELLVAAAKSGVLEVVIACKDIDSVRFLLSTAKRAPLFVSLDFSLVDGHMNLKPTQELYGQIKAKWPTIPVIGITNFEGSIEPEAEELQRRLRVSKDSVYDKSKILEALPHIFRDKYYISLLTQEKEQLQEEVSHYKNDNEELRKRLGIDLDKRKESEDFSQLKQPLIGSSQRMKEIRWHIELAAKNNDNILLLGETGTGKELVAKAIHHLSRQRGPLVIVNCAAIPETLFESELFGVSKDYPGFHSKMGKKGLVEEADGGTLFLDEIHHTSLASQAKLLRLIDDKSYYRVGEIDATRLSSTTRIIAACKPDIEKLIEEGKFLEDLYGRLNSFMPVMPPLRERKEDILVLLEHFSQFKDTQLIYTEDAKKILVDQEWKRNVRELRNFIYGVENLYSGLGSKKKKPGDPPRMLLIEADQINYALQLFYKKPASKKLVEKVLARNLDNDVEKIKESNTKEEAAKLLKAILKTLEGFPEGGKAIRQEELADKITMPSGRKGVSVNYLSTAFGLYKEYYKELMNSPDFSGKTKLAMRYKPLQKILDKSKA